MCGDKTEIYGQRYKINSWGRVVVWRDGEWIFTRNYTAAELDVEITRRKNGYREKYGH